MRQYLGRPSLLKNYQISSHLFNICSVLGCAEPSRVIPFNPYNPVTEVPVEPSLSEVKNLRLKDTKSKFSDRAVVKTQACLTQKAILLPVTGAGNSKRTKPPPSLSQGN